MTKSKNKGPKYDVSTTATCPLCNEAVLIGTAGPKGLEQHNGKKRCLANIEKRRKEAKTLTLFSFLQCRDKENAPMTTETLQNEGKQKTTAASLILVRPSTHTPLVENVGKANTKIQSCEDDNQRTDEVKNTEATSLETEKRRGCPHAWLLLDKLQAAIQNIPHNIPAGRASDKLAGFNKCAASLVCAAITKDELWEEVNPALDRMLGFGRSNMEIQELI